jgi:hypothetical protein
MDEYKLRYDIQHYDTQHNDTQHDNTENNNIKNPRFSLNNTSCYATGHYSECAEVILGVTLFCCYAMHHYAECCNAVCHYADCLGTLQTESKDT